jgi:hypothetical protein
MSRQPRGVGIGIVMLVGSGHDPSSEEEDA